MSKSRPFRVNSSPRTPIDGQIRTVPVLRATGHRLSDSRDVRAVCVHREKVIRAESRRADVQTEAIAFKYDLGRVGRVAATTVVMMRGKLGELRESRAIEIHDEDVS